MVKTSSSANPSLTHAKATNIVSAAKGSGVVFMGRLFEYAGRFLLGVMLARFMGAGQYGIYALADTGHRPAWSQPRHGLLHSLFQKYWR